MITNIYLIKLRIKYSAYSLIKYSYQQELPSNHCNIAYFHYFCNLILEDMDKNILSRLEEVDLKCFWKHEERDFTPWLSEEENIALLGEAIGMDLEVISREESVGSYRADILCKDSANGHFVVIENQIEQTDHKHLGQIITYGTGLNASSCIWIAKSFTGEHRAAIDWLNSISDDEHNFFAIEIKLYKIGNSPLAPIFNVVAKPNDWSKLIKKRCCKHSSN